MSEREAILRGQPVMVTVRELAPPGAAFDPQIPEVRLAEPAPALLAAFAGQERQKQFTLMELPEHVLAAPQTPRVKRRGHPQPPGTGPAGETCGSCAHLRSVNGGSKNFSKCFLVKHQWTRGGGSDIRRRDAACRLWQAKAARS
jgi:hypothetical protein